jgi:hypothetical protein
MKLRDTFDSLPEKDKPAFLRGVIEQRSAAGRKVPKWVTEALTALAKTEKQTRGMARRAADGRVYEKASLPSKGGVPRCNVGLGFPRLLSRCPG